MLGDTLCNKSLLYTFKATEITCEVVISAMERLLKNKTEEKSGKQSLKSLRKKGNLQYIEVTDETLKRLKRYLTRYNMDYSILKEKTEDKQFMLFFKTYDAELLEKIMTKFLENRFKEKEKIGIKEKINLIRQKSNEKTQDKKIEQIQKKERKPKYEVL